MKLKKWGILLLMTTMVAVFAVGCGGKQTAPQPNPPAQQQPTKQPKAEQPKAEEPKGGMDGMDELKDGVYVGIGQGFGGEIKLEVTITGGEIKKIVVLEHQETESIGGAALNELIKSALNSHDDNYDAVSGASQTSAGFWEAIEDVHNQAAK